MRHFNDNSVTSRMNLSMAVNTTCVSCMNQLELLLGCAILKESFLKFIHSFKNALYHPYNGMVKRLCKEEEVGYVDLWDSFVPIVGKEVLIFKCIILIKIQICFYLLSYSDCHL